jgi:metacaspase-1
MVAKGMSVHIGLNRVDPGHYGGWSGPLTGCEPDARDMHAIATQCGFDTRLLLTHEATANRAVEEIGRAARTLKAGDLFLLTYSGHGGQVRDTNGEEDDGRDETWCLYDRQLVDDELYQLWGAFEPGTRIVVLSDSCHSGSVTRVALQHDRVVSDPALTEPFGIRTRARRRNAVPPPSADSFDVPLDDDVAILRGTRRMPPSVERATEGQNAALYRQIQERSPNGDRVPVGATVLLLSGCQDSQLSSDGDRNGLFTQTLLKVWNGGTFRYGYRSFLTRIRGRMPIYQQPNYFVVGLPNPAFERQVPFTI